MSPSTQPAAVLTQEFGVRKAGLGGLKEHQGNTGKGKRLERGPNRSSVPQASAEVGAEPVTDVSARAPGEDELWPHPRLRCLLGQ